MAFTNQDRTILGPLTTVFTAPAACTVAHGFCQSCDVAWWGQTCAETTVQDNTDCWPTTTAGAPEVTELPLYGRGFYSPGLECPAGHTSACSAVDGVTSQWKVQFQMEAQETFVGCCPTGFKCDNLKGQTCLMRAKSTTLPTVSCISGSSNNFGFMTFPNSKVTTLNLYAPMIQLAWKASDRPENWTPPTTTSDSSTISGSRATSAPTTSLPSSTSTTDPFTPVNEPGTFASVAADSASPLSTGAIAGIAVGAAALFLLILAAIIFVWRRRRRHSSALRGGGQDPSNSASNPPSYSELGGSSPSMEDAKHYYAGNVAEMGQGHERAEVAGDEHGAVEAPTQGHDRAEMFAGEWQQGQGRTEQVPVRGGVSPPSPPPPGYFPGQAPVEMPTEKYT
ncbi:hypothetical protein C8A01DRAFT_14675 [Parachaetomium inaequale]|uniref:Uncharacterized protein n=1 Tax=Parachaetomium inaequale TaxID=2588326 RepID=A0AAN6STF1_9PEZI|nr:hypothetical protein C8A01DRAFT_14675 [Parachaetomium inaequale]